jgi:membrane associated rhomboid family serine protease
MKKYKKTPLVITLGVVFAIILWIISKLFIPIDTPNLKDIQLSYALSGFLIGYIIVELFYIVND